LRLIGQFKAASVRRQEESQFQHISRDGHPLTLPQIQPLGYVFEIQRSINVAEKLDLLFEIDRFARCQSLFQLAIIQPPRLSEQERKLVDTVLTEESHVADVVLAAGDEFFDTLLNRS
jgi:hypothetical protein